VRPFCFFLRVFCEASDERYFDIPAPPSQMSAPANNPRRHNIIPTHVPNVLEIMSIVSDWRVGRWDRRTSILRLISPPRTVTVKAVRLMDGFSESQAQDRKPEDPVGPCNRQRGSGNVEPPWPECHRCTPPYPERPS